MAKQKINVNGIEVRIKKEKDTDYISLTDIAKRSSDEPRFIIRNWLRNSNTVKYLYEWEEIHFPNSNRADIGTVLEIALDNNVSLTPSKWINLIQAEGITSASGRYGGTYAHSDIALNFCYWLSPKFQIYFIKEFQRLKAEEQLRLGDPFNIKRFLTTGNYSLLVTSILSQVDERLLTHPQPYKSRLPFAAEADMINKIVFGNTSKEWRLHNMDKPTNRNQRDYANVLDLTVLNNLEFLDAMLIQ
ncbi:MAG: KilA-N domain-containing protein [Saprospiraceae bacterium]